MHPFLLVDLFVFLSSNYLQGIPFQVLPQCTFTLFRKFFTDSKSIKMRVYTPRSTGNFSYLAILFLLTEDSRTLLIVD